MFIVGVTDKSNILVIHLFSILLMKMARTMKIVNLPFITGVNDTSDKFTATVNDTGDNLMTV